MSLSISENKYVTDHAPYHKNIADTDTLEDAIDNHSHTFVDKFKAASADRAYYDKYLIEELEKSYKIEIAIRHKKRTYARCPLI